MQPPYPGGQFGTRPRLPGSNPGGGPTTRLAAATSAVSQVLTPQDVGDRRCRRPSDDRQRVEHRAGRALDLQREREEEELVDLLPRDLLEVDRFEQVDAVLDEQQGVHRLRVGRAAR